MQFDTEAGRAGGRMSARDVQRLKGPHQLADKYLTLPISELDVSEWEVRCVRCGAEELLHLLARSAVAAAESWGCPAGVLWHRHPAVSA